MFFVPIPEPELNRSSRRIRTALLDIVDALAPMDINCNYKCIFLRNVDNANHGTRNPEANYLACIHITANDYVYSKDHPILTGLTAFKS